MNANNMTVENCVNFCNTQNFIYAGVENGQECCKWHFRSSPTCDACLLTVLLKDCGTAIANDGTPTSQTDCSAVCSGNSSEFCGGPNRLNVYNYTGINHPSIASLPVDGGDEQDRLSVYTSSGSVKARAVPTVQTTSLPGNWQYSRCLAYAFFAFLSTCNR
jgi:hypothetical protein